MFFCALFLRKKGVGTRDPSQYRPSLLVSPFRNAAWCPRSTGGFHLFLKSRQVTLDQLAQLGERLLKLLGCRRVLIDLRLRRPSRGQALCSNNVINALRNRRRQVNVARSQDRVTTQSAQNVVRAFIKGGGIIEQLVTSTWRIQQCPTDKGQSRLQGIGSFQRTLHGTLQSDRKSTRLNSSH